MGLLTRSTPDTASSLRADAQDNRAQYLANADAISERIVTRSDVIAARLAALEAEQADLANIQV